MIYHFKTYIWLGTFRYNCTRGQLNNKGGEELHEINQSQDKTEIGKEIIWEQWTDILWSQSLEHEIVLQHEKVTCIKYLYWNLFQ